MNSMVVIEPMAEVEARACLMAIRGNLQAAAALVREFDERRGWAALQYNSLRECLALELGYSEKHGYRLEAAARVVANIQQHSPMGETVLLKERWIRDSGITKLDAPEQAQAYLTAKKLAATEARPMQTRHIVQAVRTIQRQSTVVFNCIYAVVTNLVLTQFITPERGKALADAIDRLKPKKRAYIVQLIAQYKLNDPELVAPIAGMFDRPPGQESYVLPEVLAGRLNGKFLDKATTADLQRANAEAQEQHKAVAAEQKRQTQLAAGEIPVEEIAVTIYKGDPGKTIRALQQALGDEFKTLHKAMLGL